MNGRTYILLLCLPLALLFASVAPFSAARAQGVPIHNTMGDPYEPYFLNHLTYWGGGGTFGRSIANQFSLTNTYTLTALTLDISRDNTTPPNTPNLRIAIVADDGGMPSTNILDIIAFNPEDITLTRQLHTYGSLLQPTLGPGDYWLLLEPSFLDPAPTNAYPTYYISTPSTPFETVNAIRTFNPEAGSWDSWTLLPSVRPPAFRLDGLVVVPEPSTWALLALGSAAFFATRRRRK